MDVAPPAPEVPPVPEAPPVPEQIIVMQPAPPIGAQMLQLALQQYSPEPHVALPHGVPAPLLPPVAALPPVPGAPPRELAPPVDGVTEHWGVLGKHWLFESQYFITAVSPQFVSLGAHSVQVLPHNLPWHG